MADGREGLAERTKSTVKSAQRIQEETNRRDEARPEAKENGKPMQARPAGLPRGFSGTAFKKAGLEAELEAKPMYEAPDYKGSGKLEGMAALITGGNSGIGRAVAVLYAREGADIAVVYLDEHKDAEETKRAVEREGRRCR